MELRNTLYGRYEFVLGDLLVKIGSDDRVHVRRVPFF
jgi:hypothetical protein